MHPSTKPSRLPDFTSSDNAALRQKGILSEHAFAPARPRDILIGVIAVAGVGHLLESELPFGIALAGIALMLAWWRLRLPPP